MRARRRKPIRKPVARSAAYVPPLLDPAFKSIPREYLRSEGERPSPLPPAWIPLIEASAEFREDARRRMLVRLRAEFADAIERARQGLPVGSWRKDPLRLSSAYARAGARRIMVAIDRTVAPGVA